MQTEPIYLLRERLQSPLPGREAQYRMAHAVRRSHADPPPDARIACVLALLYPQRAGWHLALIERMASNPNDRHGGQISFPGGKQEKDDPSLLFTALRETEEEIGVPAQGVNVLGELTELYIPVSNFIVHPFVGYLDFTPEFQPQPEEVRSIVEVPLSLLQDPTSIQTTDLRLAPNLVLKQVPYYNVGGKVVWGATAMMLSELLEVLG
ncbi:MAG: CoA pyrophosphatase [Saprospiraceae bacterium]|nr:CoA pyrophosphatase [Saprospiraceae bacterium]MCB0624546.1 CoA pyrophosphatase [Saprospiraceae bacterium]MCB0676008.1 CoA pyrophosphatase [Saprospiraceae bacterium]MCB0682387.1 CoA pyrophosphatase [Saprospiraceae bacterium]